MKRKEIYVAVIIDTISQNNSGDEAYIFNTKKEALDWAEAIKGSMEDMGCPLCENQLFIQKVDMSIDYLNRWDEQNVWQEDFDDEKIY